jgi:hypothetical protein
MSSPDGTTDGKVKAKGIEAAEPKAGHRLPPMRASHTPATAVDCYEVYSLIMRVAACPQRELQSAQERPKRRRFGGQACSAAMGLLSQQVWRAFDSGTIAAAAPHPPLPAARARWHNACPVYAECWQRGGSLVEGRSEAGRRERRAERPLA